VFITSCAELPGLLLAAFIIDRIGRKRTQALLLFICGVFTLLLISTSNTYVLMVLAFIGRATIMGAFCSAWVYTPEVYPTVVRTTGLGVASAMAKLAGIITPFIATVLPSIANWIPILIYGGFCFLSTVAALLLPIETKNRALPDSVNPLGQETTSLLPAEPLPTPLDE